MKNKRKRDSIPKDLRHPKFLCLLRGHPSVQYLKLKFLLSGATLKVVQRKGKDNCLAGLSLFTDFLSWESLSQTMKQEIQQKVQGWKFTWSNDPCRCVIKERKSLSKIEIYSLDKEIVSEVKALIKKIIESNFSGNYIIKGFDEILPKCAEPMIIAILQEYFNESEYKIEYSNTNLPQQWNILWVTLNCWENDYINVQDKIDEKLKIFVKRSHKLDDETFLICQHIFIQGKSVLDYLWEESI